MGVTSYLLWWAVIALGLTSYISLFCKLATLDSMDGRCTILVGHLAWHGKGSVGYGAWHALKMAGENSVSAKDCTLQY
jgi:hypothetical protein